MQAETDADGGEVSPAALWTSFADEYLPARTPAARTPWGRFELRQHAPDSDGRRRRPASRSTLTDDGQEVTIEGDRQRPDRRVRRRPWPAADVDVRVLDYAEHALSAGGDARAAAYVECAVGERVLWGVGIDADIVTASLKAVVSAVNRAERG